jgi:hypothetical protein
MLRTLLIAGVLLTASGASFAHGDDYGYGRVVAVEPHVVISFGTCYPDGFRVLYESGGARYWTHTAYYPDRVIVLPPPYQAEHRYRRDWDDRGWNRRHDGWRDRHHERRHHDDD